MYIEESVKISRGWIYKQIKLIPTKENKKVKNKYEEKYISTKAEVKQVNIFELSR